jgi:hypothetical protein
MFAFATCNRENALGFLRKLYPEQTINDTEDSAKSLLDIIEADELRVCDPDFHGGQIIEGRHFREDTAPRAMAALEKAGLYFKRT